MFVLPSKLLIHTGTECFAWPLMTNYFHLLLRPRNSRLALHAPAETLVSSSWCATSLNPLRAGLVAILDDLNAYQWAGHTILLGNCELKGQVVDENLGFFSAARKNARHEYRNFVAAGITMGRRADLVGIWQKNRSPETEEGEKELFDSRVLAERLLFRT